MKNPPCISPRVMMIAHHDMKAAKWAFEKSEGKLVTMVVMHRLDGTVQALPMIIPDRAAEDAMMGIIDAAIPGCTAVTLICESTSATISAEEVKRLKEAGLPMPRAKDVPGATDELAVHLWTTEGRRLLWAAEITRGPLINTLDDWELKIDSAEMAQELTTRSHFE